MSGLFVVIAYDAQDVEALRAKHRQGHLEHFKSIAAHIAVGGPILHSDGTGKGSLVILRADSADHAAAMLERDPFFKAGVWNAIEVSGFKAGSGDWVPQP